MCPFAVLLDFRIYRNGRGRRGCSDFVRILFIFGNMIQKSLFVYYCRKKVWKSIVIKKIVVSLRCRSFDIQPVCGNRDSERHAIPQKGTKKRVFPHSRILSVTGKKARGRLE